MFGLLWMGVLAACNGKVNDSVPDGDADTDTDSDTDTDTDTDTDPAWTGIEGTLTYEWVVGGTTLCDATIEFSGTRYTGDCPDCDFAFATEGTLVRNDGTEACPFYPTASIYESMIDRDSPTIVAFASEMNGGAYTDALLVGQTYVYEDGTSSVYMPSYSVMYDGSPWGLASLDGGSLDWSFTFETGGPTLFEDEEWEFMHYPDIAYCGWDSESTATAPYGAGNTIEGSIPIVHDYLDAFTFQGEAGGTAYITVDSMGAGIDPQVYVYGPDSCIVKAAADNFRCSNGATDCPALAVDTDDAEYTLVVSEQAGWDATTVEMGDYRLDLDASWDPKLTQIQDDLSNVEAGHLTVTASATLSE